MKRFPLDTVCIARLLHGLPGCDTQVHRAGGPRNQPTHTGRRHTCTRRQNTETCACHCRWGSRSLFSRCRTTTTSWRALTAALPQRLLGQLACGESCADKEIITSTSHQEEGPEAMLPRTWDAVALQVVLPPLRHARNHRRRVGTNTSGDMQDCPEEYNIRTHQI